MDHYRTSRRMECVWRSRARDLHRRRVHIESAQSLRSEVGRRWRTLNIAHRGSSGTHPENTIAAFLAAANEGADMCELDVQATRDGAVVVHP